MLFLILFSSQSRCIAPTKTFTEGTGYGCFGYVPIVWTEESRLVQYEDFVEFNEKFYDKPGLSSNIYLYGFYLFIINLIST